MPWVAFIRNFDWAVTRRSVLAYKAETEICVPQECARAALLMGCARKIKRPDTLRMSKSGKEAHAS